MRERIYLICYGKGKSVLMLGLNTENKLCCETNMQCGKEIGSFPLRGLESKM